MTLHRGRRKAPHNMARHVWPEADQSTSNGAGRFAADEKSAHCTQTPTADEVRPSHAKMALPKRPGRRILRQTRLDEAEDGVVLLARAGFQHLARPL